MIAANAMRLAFTGLVRGRPMGSGMLEAFVALFTLAVVALLVLLKYALPALQIADRLGAWKAGKDPSVWLRDVARTAVRLDSRGDEDILVPLHELVTAVRQRARSGDLVVFGKPLGHMDAPEEVIPAEYWRNWTINTQALLRSAFEEHVSTTKATAMRPAEGTEYFHLRVKRSAAKRLLKHVRRGRAGSLRSRFERMISHRR